MRRRIDRFIDDSLLGFATWYVSSKWHGKERDCVNLFAMRDLAAQVQPGAAIGHQSQIRIECAVAQPEGYPRISATKDLVIWRHPEETAWNDIWLPVNLPRVVMEWKTRRRARALLDFDNHDREWLKKFTKQNPGTFGYLVTVCDRKEDRSVAWAKVTDGVIAKPKEIHGTGSGD